MRVWRLEALTDDDVATIVRRALDDAERGLAGEFGPPGAWRWPTSRSSTSSALAGGDARQALNILEGAVALAEDDDERGRRGPRLPHARGRRGRRPAARPRLRPRRRRPLRHRLRVHQEPPGQRPGRGPVLARVDDRGRRGPPVHRAAADHQRLGGRRERRPAGPPGRRRGGPGARPRRAARGAVRPRPGDDLHRHRAEVEPGGRRLLGRRRRRRGARLAAGPDPPPDRRRPAR